MPEVMHNELDSGFAIHAFASLMLSRKERKEKRAKQVKLYKNKRAIDLSHFKTFAFLAEERSLCEMYFDGRK